jgi:tripartite-type tricarboxylate transporter receptor subunit TctC
MMRLIAAAALGAWCLVAASPAVFAQSYPTRPVRVIVPFAAGGQSDVIGRIVAQKYGERLGQQFVVDNRPGAGGSIGADAVAKSAPDGYTLLLGSTSEVAVYPNVNPKAPYDTRRDFAPVGLVGTVPLVFVTTPSLPVKSVQDLIQLAKAKPGVISYGSAGTGSTTHLAMELFASMAGIRITHIPYKGSAPVVNDLLSGNLQLALSTMPPALPHARAGRLTLLAVSTARRSAALPEVPTVEEAGVTGYAVGLWNGVLAPAKTPPEIVARLNAELVAMLDLPDVREALAKQGAEPTRSTPDEFTAQIKTDLATWAKVVKEGGIRID